MPAPNLVKCNICKTRMSSITKHSIINILSCLKDCEEEYVGKLNQRDKARVQLQQKEEAIDILLNELRKYILRK